MKNNKVANAVREILTLEDKYSETTYNELGLLALCVDLAEDSLYKEDGMMILVGQLDEIMDSIVNDGRPVPSSLSEVRELVKNAA